MNQIERQEKIVAYLRPSSQPASTSSDRLDEITSLLQGIALEGDLVALLQVSAYANALAQRVAADR